MKNITTITRRDIYELFRDGYDEYSFIGTDKMQYHYFGRLEEIEFLKLLYDLDNMPSTNNRFKNATDDIWQHTVNNDDWDYCWVFKDERFGLEMGDDKVLLDFICKVFDPAVRSEKGNWKNFFYKINSILKADGYEIYEQSRISNRAVYYWRTISDIEKNSDSPVPFSIRKPQSKKVKFTITMKVRGEILVILGRYNESFQETTETGWNYNTETVLEVMKSLAEFYKPCAFDSKGVYAVAPSYIEFIKKNHYYCVFDFLELFSRYCTTNNFVTEINAKLKGLGYSLQDCKIEPFNEIIETISQPIQEIGLRELLEQALALFKDNARKDNKQLATEKIWGAFERLKSYYISTSPKVDKKQSVEKIVKDMANSNVDYINFFNEEFKRLTDIGNKYRIRHHEVNKIDIIDDLYYDYFFGRCYTLISLALKYLK